MRARHPRYVRLIRENRALRARLDEAERSLEAVGRAEHQQSEAVIGRLAERLDLATRAAHMGVWDWDILKNELVWDDRMYRLYGLERGDFAGAYEAWLHGLHPDDRAASDAISASARRGECAYDTEFRVVWPDGTVRVLKAYGDVIRAPDGTALRMIGVNFDITELKRAEAALRESEARIRNLLEHVPIGMFQSTPEGQIVYVNPAYAAMMGYDSPEELIAIVNQRSVAEVLYEDPSRRPPLVSEVAQAQGAWRVYENRYRRKDGRIIDAILSFSERSDPITGQPALFGFVQDITARKQAEVALRLLNETLEQRVAERTADLRRANAELARVGRLKDEFLATMSHELRTPLNAILGRAELLEDELYGPLTPRQLGAVRSIETSGRHLLELINDILDLSSIEAGKLQLRVEPVAVDVVCQLSIQMVAASAAAKRIAHSVTIDPRVGSIDADGRRLRQILVNLLANAVKFTPAGGVIGLEVRGDVEGQRLTFTVSDTGIGIAEEDLPHLFQPFVQIDGGLNRQYEGTGLGLSLVRRLAEAHQGRVSVTSTPGLGSRFSVSLPWSPAPGGPAPASAAAASVCRPPAHESASREPPPAGALDDGARQAYILVADDNAEHRQIVACYLEAHGYTVRAARDGREALTLAQEDRPACVLMDMQMPHLDGLEATRRIRGDDRLRTVPIVALTALAMPDERRRCLDAGATAYLSKPVRLRELISTIRDLLGG